MNRIISLILLAVAVANAATIRKDVPLQENFDLTKYTGKWFEMYRSKAMFFESGTDNSAEYGANTNGTVSVVNKEWLPEKNEWNVATAVATVLGNAHLSVKFGPLQPAGDYRVLYTDYENVAVVYSATKVFGVEAFKLGWILARSVDVDEQVLANALEIMKNVAGLEADSFLKTQHGIAPQAALVATSQDRAYGNVELQENFDPDRYLGRWYEIYRTLNMEFESGTDGNANYKWGDKAKSFIDVTNKEWKEEQQVWGVVKGRGEIVQGAQLTIQFGSPFAPKGDYRVMYTDYEGITVVYSKSSKFSKTYGWVLARTETITAEQKKKAFSTFAKVGLEEDDFLFVPRGRATKPEPMY